MRSVAGHVRRAQERESAPGGLCLNQDTQGPSIIQGPAQQWASPDVYALRRSICNAQSMPVFVLSI